MTTFSANLGFLWADLSLPDAIRAAHAAGFAAVECHWPYETPAMDVKSALDETELPMLGLNTRRGDVAGGENGLSALPGRKKEARAAIDEAIAYAHAIDAGAIHVMAGFAQGLEAEATFIENLSYACTQAPDLTLLIEPLNPHDAPGYFLSTTEKAQAIIEVVERPNLKLMFDCYHVARTQGDLVTRLKALRSYLGHIQFASVPDRGAPDQNEIDYDWVFREIDKLGWKTPLGAEYKPIGKTNDSLDWLKRWLPDSMPT